MLRLNTYLDLKVDNECLQQKLKYLKSSIPAQLAASAQVPPPLYETATTNSSPAPEAAVQSFEPSSSSTDLNSTTLEEVLTKNTFEGSSGKFYGAATIVPPEEEGEDVSKKKKVSCVGLVEIIILD